MGNASGFGDSLRRYRVAAGLTQEELAERAGISARAVSDLERGLYKAPRRDTVQLLAEALGLNPEEQSELEGTITRSRGPDDGKRHDTPTQELPTGGFLGALSAAPLVGRERELAQILEVVDTAVSGTGQLVVLAGEPGAGKTRLAQEVTLHLRNRGVLLAAGRCYEPEQTVPYYPFLDALATVYAAAPPGIQRDTARRWPYLGALLPEQIGVPEVAGGSGQDEQQRVFRAVTGFLGAIAEGRPVALLLDDLHWADSSSLKLLLHLARHTRPMPVFLLGTYRDVEVGRRHPLEGALRDLHRDDLIERVVVRRLDEERTEQLIATMMGEKDVSREFTALVYARTEGNPYFVQQVLRMLVERGDVFRRGAMWDRRAIEEIEVPESVRSVVGQRLSRLNERTEAVLQEASVLGQTFTFDDLLGISEFGERELEAALDEAAQAGLIRDLGRDTYSFDHALTQQAIYAELSSRRQRRLHIAVAEMLERLPEGKQGGRVGEIAWHYMQADDRERALLWAIRAGDAAVAVFAYSDADVQYRGAIELARDLNETATEAQVLEKLGGVLATAGQYDEALEPLRRAVETNHELRDLEAVGRVTAQMAMVHRHRRSAEEGIALVQPMVDLLAPSGPSPALAALHITLASLSFLVGDYRAMLVTAERGGEIARAIDAQRLLGESEERRATALTFLGQPQEALPIFEGAIPLIEAGGDLMVLWRAFNNLAVAHEQLGRQLMHREYLERALAVAKRMGNSDQIAFILANLGSALTNLGDWGAARDACEQAMVLLGEVPGANAANILLQLGELTLYEGDWDEAERLLNEAVAVTERTTQRTVHEQAQALVAELEVLTGRPEKAIARVEGLATTEDVYFQVPIVLACAQLEAGAVDRATTVIEGLVTTARGQGQRMPLMLALRVQGMVLRRRGQEKEATAALEEGLALAQEMPYPYMEARILEQLGRAEEALTIFRALGARRDVERLQQAWLTEK